MKQKDLLKKIEDLEKRIAGLEARPPAIINIPYPVYVPQPYYVQNPQWVPFNPWRDTWITCDTGTIGTITTMPTPFTLTS